MTNPNKKEEVKVSMLVGELDDLDLPIQHQIKIAVYIEKLLLQKEKEVRRIEWLRHIEFLIRHIKQAEVAGDKLYEIEMRDALKVSENWYENIYDEKPNISELIELEKKELNAFIEREEK